MSVFPLKIKRNGQRNEFKVHHGWIFSYKSTDRFNCYSYSRFCACWVGHYLRLASKKSNSQVRTNLRQKGTGKSSLKVTCILTMKSKVRFRKVAFARGHKNDQNRKLTLTFSLWWLLSHAEAGMKKGKLGLNILLLIYWLKLLDCTCWIYVYNKCLKFVSHKLCYTQQPLTMIGLYAFFFLNQLIGRGCSSDFKR